MASFSLTYEGYAVGSQRKPVKKSAVSSKVDARVTVPAPTRREKMPLPPQHALPSSAAPYENQSGRKLEAMRDCYEALYDYSLAGFLTLDTLGKIVDANLTAATMLGITRKALIGQPLVDFIRRDDQKNFQLHCRNVLKKETQQRCEVQIREETGLVRWVSLESGAVQDDSGRIDHWWTMLLDITERKQAAEKMAQRAERLELATSAAHIGVWDWNIQKNELLWDDGMFTLYGAKKTHFGSAYDAWLSRVHPEDQARCDEAIQQAMRMERPYDIDFRICWPDGTVRIIKADGQVIWGMDGTPLRMTGVNYDITDRKRAEAALQTTKEQLQQALIASNTGLWDWNTDTNEVYFSKEWKSQLGYGEEELANAFETWSALLHIEDRDSATAYVLAYLKNPVGNYRQEFRLRHKDGSYRWIAAVASFVTEPDGRQVRLLGAHSDITEHKQLEAQFRQAQKMEAVGRFSASVAHDFNNLLLVINGYSKMLTDRLPSEDPRHKMAAETLAAGERASALTKQLLAFSRRQVLRLEPILLNDSIRAISTMLSRLLGDDVTLTLNLAPDLWSISADKGQFDQVVMNLAVNARDAMPDGGAVTIVTHNVELTTDAPDTHGIMPAGNYVQLSICDTGQGMSRETMAHIFEPFFTTKEMGKGTGLGLATVYGIVKQSHGYIFVDSAPEQGSTFHLYYPRVAAASIVEETAPVDRARGSETLLVVEDQDSVRSLIVGVLMREGYRVIEATTVEDAVRVAASLPEPVKALVTDIVMPQMTGLALAERLREVWPDLKVFFMCGYSGIELSNLLDKPENACIQKPFLPKDLVEQLREFLDKPI
jgi:two-component system cell cycle sensor histidine kinase/response regulator CckA